MSGSNRRPGARRRRGGAAAWAVGAGTIPIAAALAVRVASGSMLTSPLRPSAAAEAAAAALVLETAMLVVIAPLAGVLLVGNTTVDSCGNAGASAVGWRRGWTVALPLLVAATACCAVSAGLQLALRGDADVTVLAASHATLWAAVMSLAALGACCAARFADPLDAAATAVGVALIAAAGVLVAGPALDLAPRDMIGLALLANPIVATASAANIDLFRTDILYQLSPVAHTQVTYPAAPAAFLSYAAAAAVLLIATILQLDRRARAASLERTSA